MMRLKLIDLESFSRIKLFFIMLISIKILLTLSGSTLRLILSKSLSKR